MDLRDFGSHYMSKAKQVSRRRRRKKDRPQNGPVQWRCEVTGIYEPCVYTRRALPAGAYTVATPYEKPVQFHAKDLQVDDLVDFPGSLSEKLLHEIEEFWSLGEQFRRLGYLHRRGYFFYGPQGSGKSSVVHQVVAQVIQAGHVAFFCGDPDEFIQAMLLFRRIETDRPVVCVFEDIDATIEQHKESQLLQWLDGFHRINAVINIATTNYPEKLDRRLVSRPRRFDRIVKIEAASREVRQEYLARKMPALPSLELEEWVDKTSGLSVAALAELVISVACFGKSFDETLGRLQRMEEQQLSSDEFDHPFPIGFKTNGHDRNGSSA